MALICREADPAFDRWDELHRLLMDCFAYMAVRIDPPSSLLRMGPAELAEKAGSETLLLAEEDGRIVGCAFLRLEPDCLYIGKVAVAPAFRGAGLARRLFVLAEERARANDRLFLKLQTRVELTENHAAFARLGFVKVSETAHAGYDRATSITMTKPVDPSRQDRAFSEALHERA
ncbi:N-acetylglutamate synthase-like GNAT family acetyltransferase [Rhodopseudomonas julia]|uniref:N-acetylglutamate synthase-like GNAT family acetyltransferase n=1 Tax=Rhodopseudomonas julia TaxID=200617 RepID=A0ABU0C1L8_9BRAD|nr:GNAT family N-acetyltransferase [Rhodopseudomonas julia]MDQ0324406.1 N-acetylglutamate synthase-like GNAT family acetyltransferase [Rhodopseudomonas julia]